MDTQIQTTAADQKISDKLAPQYSAEQIAVLKASVAKGLTDTQFAYFITLAKSVDLNPFLKQIWAYPDGRGGVLTFAGRDGFMANAQRHKDFAGIRSCEICANDIFEADIPNGTITHKVTKLTAAERGAITGAYAIVYRKGKKDTLALVTFDAYNRKIGAWQSHPAAMICKVAETKALKMAYGLELQSEYEFDVKEGVAVPRAHKPRTQMDEWRGALLDAFDRYTGDDKADLQAMAAEKFATGEVDEAFVLNLLQQLEEPQGEGQQELPL